MGRIKHHLEQAPLAANRFQRRLTSHLKLALDPSFEAFHQFLSLLRCGYGIIDTALERHLLNPVTMLEGERQ